MKRTFVYLALLLLTTIGLSAQTNPFMPGEQLTYTMSYHAKMWPNTDMGKTVFNVSESLVDGHEAYLISCRSTTSKFFGAFYKMDDRYNTWLSKQNLRPLKSTSKKIEGSYRFHSTILYNWNTMTANSAYRNEDWPEDHHKTMSISEKSVDAMNLMYMFRLQNIANWKTGSERSIELVSENKVQTVKYRYMGIENVKVQGLGTVKAYKLVCQIIEEVQLEQGEKPEFTVWVTADRNLLPVLMKTPTKIGNIRVRLSDYKGLKYPVEAIEK